MPLVVRACRLLFARNTSDTHIRLCVTHSKACKMSQATYAVAVFSPLFPPARDGGGPIRTLEALTQTAPDGFDIFVLTSDRDHNATLPMAVESGQWIRSGRLKVYYASTNPLLSMIRAYTSVRRQRPDVLYINGFFNAWFSIVPQLLWRLTFWRKPVRMLAPRGEFGEGALRRRQAKKRAFIAVYKTLLLHRGLYWHASSEDERMDIQRVWGRKARVLVRENETSLPLIADDAPLVTHRSNALTVVFIGRIVEHKGLHRLLAALRTVDAKVNLDIYGIDEDLRYLALCLDAQRQLPRNVRVRFLGPVASQDVRHTLAAYDLMILPTSGENFGHTIAEALSVSCPVLTTAATPWTKTLGNGGGAIISRDEQDIAEAVKRYANLSVQERAARRAAAGRAYNAWRQAEKGPHVFEALRLRVATRSQHASPPHG